MQTYLAEKTLTDRLFGWWYAISTPEISAENAPLRIREAIRQAKFLSVILLIEIILSIGDYVTGLAYGYGLTLYIPVTISVASLIAGVILNRKGKMLTGVIVILVVFEINMGFFLISETFAAPGGLTPIAVNAFIILLQPGIIAASLLPAPAALSVGLLNCLFTITVLAFAPQSPELINLPPGVFFNAVFVNITTQIVIMIVNVFWTSSVKQEMQRADRAEEVNKLIEELATQQQQALEEKQRLEESIQQIVKVHTQIANGDLNARVPLDQGNVLWLIAGSLNNLISRLQRWRQDAKKQQQTEQAIQYLILALQTAKRQGTQISVQKTGTPIDPLIAEIINDSSFARPDHIYPETSFPEGSSSWSSGTNMPPPTSSKLDQVPFPTNNEASYFHPPFNIPLPER
jgi:type II secretory pathway pseudopilin PulG